MTPLEGFTYGELWEVIWPGETTGPLFTDGASAETYAHRIQARGIQATPMKIPVWTQDTTTP